MIKQKKTSNLITDLIVSLIVNHEEYLLRVLADKGASSSTIPADTYILKLMTVLKWAVNLLQTKTGL
jgi:hypothetical protein